MVFSEDLLMKRFLSALLGKNSSYGNRDSDYQLKRKAVSGMLYKDKLIKMSEFVKGHV